MGQGGLEKKQRKRKDLRGGGGSGRGRDRDRLSLSGRGRSDYKRTKGRNVGGRRTRATVNSMDPLCFPGKQQQLHTEAAAGNRSNSWPLWADPGRSGPIWAVLGRSGPISADLGRSGPIGAVLGRSGPSWADLGSSGPIGAALGRSGAICAIMGDLGRSGPSWASRAYARTFKVTQRATTKAPSCVPHMPARKATTRRHRRHGNPPTHPARAR